MAKTVLIVDDEENILTVLEMRLETAGYEVRTAKDGQDALNKVKESAPDLILMDVMMPPPNGYQVCRQLKDDPQYRDIPVILLTAKSTESDKFWGMESGADAYLTKPYNSEEVLSKIATFFEA